MLDAAAPEPAPLDLHALSDLEWDVYKIVARGAGATAGVVEAYGGEPGQANEVLRSLADSGWIVADEGYWEPTVAAFEVHVQAANDARQQGDATARADR